MNPPPPITPQIPAPEISAPSPASSFARQAASFSLVAPVVSIGLNVLGHQAVQGNRMGMIVLGGTCSLLILAGFVMGIVALVGTRKHGRKGIFGRAIAGTCIKGIIVFFMLIAIPGFLKEADVAKKPKRH